MCTCNKLKHCVSFAEARRYAQSKKFFEQSLNILQSPGHEVLDQERKIQRLKDILHDIGMLENKEKHEPK